MPGRTQHRCSRASVVPTDNSLAAAMDLRIATRLPSWDPPSTILPSPSMALAARTRRTSSVISVGISGQLMVAEIGEITVEREMLLDDAGAKRRRSVRRPLCLRYDPNSRRLRRSCVSASISLPGWLPPEASDSLTRNEAVRAHRDVQERPRHAQCTFCGFDIGQGRQSRRQDDGKL